MHVLFSLFFTGGIFKPKDMKTRQESRILQVVINYLPQQRKRYCRTPANQSQHSITTFGDILWVWKIFFFFVLVYIYGFLLQRWEVLMRVHEPLPPDNKYLSTKPINTVIAGARTDLLVIMPSGCFRIRPSQPPANPSVCNMLHILWFPQKEK